MTHLLTLTDQKILELCQKYGEQARFWRQKFVGLLPEVNKRKLYLQKNFSSIFEFAKKLAGMSEEQVRTVLNLEKKFADKPILKELLVQGRVSVNKLVRIQSIATKENEEFWANQARILPNRALETLVRDERKIAEKQLTAIRGGNINGSQEALFEEKSLHVQTSSLQLSDEVNQKLFELQQKGININVLILEMLQKRELEIVREKEQVSSKASETNSRYIPIPIRKLLTKEHGNKCSIPTCQKPSEVIHHTQRFALTHNHDPRYLAPMCKEHHIIAHSIDVKFQRERAISL